MLLQLLALWAVYMGYIYGLYVWKWVVYMGHMCCSSGLKIVLKIDDKIGLQNDWNWVAKMAKTGLPKWLKKTYENG
jgi:hypothetical protein